MSISVSVYIYVYTVPFFVIFCHSAGVLQAFRFNDYKRENPHNRESLHKNEFI